MRRLSWIVALLLGPILLGSAQELKGPQSPEEDASINFRSFSRMVLVDVVVKDGKGRVIHGLKPEDFELYEDNVPHRVASFSESTERFARTTPPVSAAHLTDVFTNARPREEADVRPSIVLLDLLNTSIQDRPLARRALLKFVEQRMQRDEPIAIFVLWNKLELLVDFTGDARLIKAPLQADQRTFGDPKKEHMATDMMIRVADLFANPSDALAIAGDNTRLLDQVYKQLAESTERIEDQFESERAMNRVERTLSALRTIARFAEKHRGRKSLVWLSAAFPFSIQTEFGLVDFDDQIRQTSNQLSTAQVAVYPVDVRGLTPVEAKPFEEDLSKVWLESPQDVAPQKFQEAYHLLFDSQNTMKELADLTGGVAFTNRNDLDVAIAAAFEDNRDTYTLGYYPLKKRFDSRFRRIKVRLKGQSAELRYRKGYYATGFSIENKTSSDLLAALERDPTVSAQIPLFSRLQPSMPSANQPFKVELFVKGGNIHYMKVDDRNAAFLDFAAVALSPTGQLVARTWHRGELKLDAARAAKAEHSGMLYSLPINLPAGAYKIRAGIRDSFTGRIGTVEIPVVIK